MRPLVGVLLALAASLIVSVPVFAATDAAPAQDALPLGLAIAVLAGLIAFGYFFMRPWRTTGRKD